MNLLSKQLLLKLYFLTSALESAVVFYLLLSIPSDFKNILFLGYSLQRLFLLSAVFIVCFIFSLFFMWIIVSEKFLGHTTIFVENVINSRFRSFVLSFFSLTLVFSAMVIFLLPLERSKDYAAYLERLAPIIYLGGGVGVQTLLGQFLWHGQKLNWNAFNGWKKIFIFTGMVFGILLAFSTWVSMTGIGLHPEIYGWHYPGAPIVFSQLFLAWLVGLPFIIWGDTIEKWVTNCQKKQFPQIRLDLIICLILWLGASLLWWGEPMLDESYFTPSPTPPNFEYYPYSDAALYDQSAQNMLIGADQNNKIILRPLYIIFLAFLHVIGGQRYDSVIFFQILFLAVMPALAYLLASMLGGRSAGILTAILIILREKNAIALTNVIEISHSKLLLSDVPMMALMILMVYVLIKWLKSSSNVDYLGALTGASFGLVMLVRSHQALLIVPALLIGMAFSGGFQLKRALQRILMFVLGLAIVVTPWIWRNYEVTGKPAVEISEFYFTWYAGAYTEPGDTVDVLPGESSEDYSRRIKRQVFQYVINHPVELARVYATYFIRNEIASIVYLPMSLKLHNLRSYISDMQFWSDPLISFTVSSGLIFFITLGFIAFGVIIAVQRLGFLGLLPLLIHFSYNFSMSFARISGWRFVQPVDWIMLFYYCIGLVALTTIVISLMSDKPSMVPCDKDKAEVTVNASSDGIKTYRFLMAFFLFVGIALPLTEILIPERYPDLSTDQRIAQHMPVRFLLENGDRITKSDVETFIETEPNAVALYGRALYPLFYEQSKFWGDNSNAFIQLVRNLNRLQFTYIGTEDAFVFIQIHLPPQYFPNASDVFIIGCREDAVIRALAIKVNDQPSFITTSPWQGLTCLTR